MKEDVILVDVHDNVLGTMQKMEAHVSGVLHRAFSVFIFNTRGELLLQKRAVDKYHSGGKWTNTCCSHPRMGEETMQAAHRRLREEMGMDCELQPTFYFTYQADVMDGLFEYEYDHVFFGISDQQPVPNPYEVAAFKYMKMDDIERELNLNNDKYTEWLKICFVKVLENYHQTF